MDLNRREQEANADYARCASVGTRIALAVIVAELLAYVSGALSPYVPLEELPRLWHMSMREYLAAARVPAGWGWVALAGRGDYVNFIGIALLASITLVCYLRALQGFLRRGERLYAALAAAQLLVLLAAASGLLNWAAGSSP
ncbi:MAG TPA: hypothetical protein VLV90_03765 [Burkholderiales bacterium]|nr:hypothetical protein [Burkholderiales bacterium]